MRTLPKDQQMIFEKQRVRLLFQQSFGVQIMGLVNAGIFAYFAKGQIEQSKMFFWGCAVLLVYLTRMSIQGYFNRTFRADESLVRTTLWENLFVFGIGMAGAVWGSVGFLFNTDAPIGYDAFLAFVLAGTTAGAAVAYCRSMKAVLAFILPSIVPLAIHLAIRGSEFGVCTSTLLCFYMIVIFQAMFRMNRHIENAAKLQFDKEALLQELVEAQAKVTQSSKMAALGTMAGSIAHEVNNPLAIIRGINGILTQYAETNTLKNDKVLQLTTTVDETVVRIAKIISSLKSFTSEVEDQPMSEVKMAGIVEDTLRVCKEHFKAQGLALYVDPISPQLVVNGRGAEISQVLLNLLTNSMEATHGRTDAWVRIECHLSDDIVSVAVIDNGPGVPKEIQDKIMLPFFTTKEVGKGPGLGLSVSHRIVELHGGTLSLDPSSLNTRFTFTLPRAGVLGQRKSA